MASNSDAGTVPDTTMGRDGATAVVNAGETKPTYKSFKYALSIYVLKFAMICSTFPFAQPGIS